MQRCPGVPFNCSCVDNTPGEKRCFSQQTLLVHEVKSECHQSPASYPAPSSASDLNTSHTEPQNVEQKQYLCMYQCHFAYTSKKAHQRQAFLLRCPDEGYPVPACRHAITLAASEAHVKTIWVQHTSVWVESGFDLAYFTLPCERFFL